MRAWLLLTLLAFASADDSSVCAAADSLARLSEFFLRNSRGMDADGYFGASIAFSVFDAAPRKAALSQLRIADACGDAKAMEFRRSIDEFGEAMEGFVARVMFAKGKAGDYDSQVYRGICRPLNAVVRSLLGDSRFHWRRLENPSVGEKIQRPTAERALGWLATSAHRLNRYNESSGDACFKKLLTARPKSRRSSCHLSTACKQQFLSARATYGYTLTHQLMFWVASVYRSCHLNLSNGLAVDRMIISNACRQALTEHRKILATGTDLIDLALEQATLCGILGYRDFFTDSTALLVRRLQDERLGCIPDSTGTSSHGGEPPGKRKLMHNVLLDGICSSHSSGLAAAYLSLYLRV